MKTLLTICLTLCLFAANASAQLLKSGTVQLIGISGTTSLTGSNGVLLIGGSPISVATISGTIAATQVTGTAATLGGNNTLSGTNNFTGPLQLSGTAISSIFQPLDGDLTAIAALATTSAGRSLLTLASVPALTGTSFNGVTLSGTNGATVTLGGYTVNQSLSTTSNPVFASGTINGVGVNVATTAATLYVDSLGSDSNGARGNKDKPFLTGNAAYAAMSDGDIIKFGWGSFTITTTGAWKQAFIVGTDPALTQLDVTITNADLSNDMHFERVTGVMSISNTTSITLPSAIIMLNAYMDTNIDTPQLDLNGCELKNYSAGGMAITYSSSPGAVLAGGMTIKGASDVGSVMQLNNVNAATEIYLKDASNCGARLYSSADTSVLGGEVNIQGGYNIQAAATVVRYKNTAYASIDATTPINGGGSRDDTVDIAAQGATSAVGSATQSLTLTSSNGIVTSVSAQTVTPAWGSVTGKPTLPTVSGTASVSVNPNGLLLGQMSETSVAVTGAAIGDEVILGPPSNPPSFISWAAYVKATGTATIRVSAIATVTGSAQTWNVKTITP